MLNSPNEWHNNKNNKEYNDDEYSNEEYEYEYVEEEYAENSDEVLEEEYEEYEKESEYEESTEYADEEEYEYADKEENNGLKKKLLIASLIFLVLLLLFGGFMGFMTLTSSKAKQKEIKNNNTEINVENNFDNNENASKSSDDSYQVKVENNKNSQNAEGEIVANETTQAEGTQNTSPSEFDDPTNEVSIDIDEQEEEIAKETQNNDKIAEKESTENSTQEEDGNSAESEKINTEDKSVSKENPTVSIALGDIGRKNPFLPLDTNQQVQQKSVEEEGLNFELIEPPGLGPEQPAINKLLSTKVSGILYDEKRPTAIINIEGVDQLVEIGDTLSDFQFIDITSNKVVIKMNENIYKASVGQPLNAEKVYNQVEISNLENKFYGERKTLKTN